MICPTCSRTIPEDSFECPFCGEPVFATQKIKVDELMWCPVCGALLAPGSESCPKCGSPVSCPPAARAERADGRSADEGGQDAAEEAPGLESAIPPTGPDVVTPSSATDVLPRIKRFVVAAAAAVAIVGGTAIAITHPWDPNAGDTRATTPYDTSDAGSPGIIDALSAQDKSAAAQQDDTSDQQQEGSGDPVFDHLVDAHEKLKEYADRVDASEQALQQAGVSGSAEERAQGLAEAQAVSIDVSNLISDLEQTSDGDGAYAEDIENLKKLGNWLRNRCDALTEAWGISAQASDPAADKDTILAPVLNTYDASGESGYKDLFDKNYEDWKPVKASS